MKILFLTYLNIKYIYSANINFDCHYKSENNIPRQLLTSQKRKNCCPGEEDHNVFSDRNSVWPSVKHQKHTVSQMKSEHMADLFNPCFPHENSI